MNMYDSRWYELTFGIQIFKHICLIMRMSNVSYRMQFKNIFLKAVMASQSKDRGWDIIPSLFISHVKPF